MKTEQSPDKLVIGKKVGRMREILGIKQEYMAIELGVNQQRISRMEKMQHIDTTTLMKIAKIYGVSVETIENFNEDLVINYMKNMTKDHANMMYEPCNCSETLQKVIGLYEKMLQIEREKR